MAATVTAPVLVPWGRGAPLSVELPGGWPAPEVAWPDLSGALADYPAALEAALERPGARFEAGPGATVAVVVDDPSRWTPVREALPVVLRRLHDAGVRPHDVSISVGVGRHHAVDEAAMR